MHCRNVERGDSLVADRAGAGEDDHPLRWLNHKCLGGACLVAERRQRPPVGGYCRPLANETEAVPTKTPMSLILKKYYYSPGILSFEMEKNNIKLKISGSAHCVLLYYL